MKSAVAPASAHSDERYLHSSLTDSIIGAFYTVYRELGMGFLESVYHEAMTRVLRSSGHRVGREIPLPVFFRGDQIAEFKADLIVDGAVIVELKAVRNLESAHEAQLLNYLKATNVEVGLLLNFGPRPQVRRLAFSNTRKDQRSSAFISG